MLLTVLLATILLLLAVILLAAKKLITGKSAPLCKRCGDPEKDHCTICSGTKKKAR